MYFALFVDILLSVLAVFGLYVLLRGCLTATSVQLAVELSEDIDVEEIPYLLQQAKRACVFGDLRIVALLPRTQRTNAALLAALQAENVTVRFVEKTESDGTDIR